MNNSQENGRKILVLGGSGAMGVYLVPELASRGYDVHVVCLEDIVSIDPRITYIKADALNSEYMKGLLLQKFDAIIDFMIYSTEQFRERFDKLLPSTEHYIFLSSYRVYSGGVPVTENTPRLLDVSEDREFLATEDYSLFKAREEDILRSSGYNNWTIVRPTITYSKFRYQLVTLEAPVVVARALQGLPIVLPKAALSVQAAMNWAGDTAKMFAGLLFNPAALQECFTLGSGEHHTWGEIAAYYHDIIGLDYVAAETDDYLAILGGHDGARYQLFYDRLFDRVVDNTKILRVAGLKQADLIPLRCGLEKELTALPRDTVWPEASAVWQKMDEYLKRI